MNWPGAQQEECQIQSLSPSKAHCSLIYFPSQREKGCLIFLLLVNLQTNLLERLRNEGGSLEVNSG